jgi:hypothetical protein
LLQRGNRRKGIARLAAFALICLFSRRAALAQSRAPEIIGLLPAGGPEGTHVEISGENLQRAYAVLFGKTQAVFDAASPEKLIAIAPHKVSTSVITGITPRGRSRSRLAFVVSNDPRIPDEVSYKAGYVNPAPRPANFGSARLWGIAIADTRVPGHESAQVEVAWTRLSCSGRRQGGCPQ